MELKLVGSLAEQHLIDEPTLVENDVEFVGRDIHAREHQKCRVLKSVSIVVERFAVAELDDVVWRPEQAYDVRLCCLPFPVGSRRLGLGWGEEESWAHRGGRWIGEVRADA